MQFHICLKRDIKFKPLIGAIYNLDWKEKQFYLNLIPPFNLATLPLKNVNIWDLLSGKEPMLFWWREKSFHILPFACKQKYIDFVVEFLVLRNTKLTLFIQISMLFISFAEMERLYLFLEKCLLWSPWIKYRNSKK